MGFAVIEMDGQICEIKASFAAMLDNDPDGLLEKSIWEWIIDGGRITVDFQRE